MIYRFMFVGYSKNIHSVRIIPNENYYVAISGNGDKVYMYVEANEERIDPELLAEVNLIKYPNGNKWERASEIFHYSKPMNPEQWRRKTEAKSPYFRVNWLKPEKVASYIFYHYQYQEEMPGSGDRYGSIYLFGEELIFYAEKPIEKETEQIRGCLHTNNSPIERWGALMEEHFADQWREIENIEASDYIEF